MSDSRDGSESEAAERLQRAGDCYGCSPTNSEGLHLEFRRSGAQEVSTEVTLRPELCGWTGVAHGGMIALLLDEVTSWCMAVCLDVQHFATRDLSVRYLRPTPTATPLLVTGRLEEDQGSAAQFVGEVRVAADRRLTARGRVTIVRLDPSKLERFVASTSRAKETEA